MESLCKCIVGVNFVRRSFVNLRCVCLEGNVARPVLVGAKLIGRAVLHRLRTGVLFDLHDGSVTFFL